MVLISIRLLTQVLDLTFKLTMKSVKYLSLLLITASLLTAQRKLDLQKDASEPEAIKQASSKNKNDDSDVSESDTGAQRPIILKKNGMSAFLGYNTDYFYTSNAFGTDANEIASGVWTNTFYAGAGLGVFDMGNYVLTPYVGGSWMIHDYTKSLNALEQENYNRTQSYALLLAQYGNGWSLRGGLSYLNDRNTNSDTEILRDFIYNFSAMKAYTIDDTTQGIFSASAKYHDVDADKSPGGTRNELNRYDLSLSYEVSKDFMGLELNPKYQITYNDYLNGNNKDRTQFTHTLSLDIVLHITESLRFETISSYTSNDSTGSGGNDDYEMYDLGGGLRLSARF